jgi:hypothetical protein
MDPIFSLAGVSISPKEGGGVELTAEGRCALTDRETVALALALLQRIPPDLGKELLGNVLGELLRTMAPADALELGLGILAQHEGELAVVAAHARAQRQGGVGSA